MGAENRSASAAAWDHPIRFAFAWLQMIVGWGAFFALAWRLKSDR